MSKLSPCGIPSAGDVIPEPLLRSDVPEVSSTHTQPIQPAFPPPPEAPNICPIS